MELITRPDFKHKDQQKALVAAGDFFRANKAQPSERCSTHVHVNVQELNRTEICNAMTLYWYLEEALLNFCDDERRGNLFCLSVQEAGFFPSAISDAVNNYTFWVNFQNGNWLNQRYGALNVASIGKFGSLEFRALEGTTDLDKVDKWADMCYAIVETGKKHKSPAAILDFVHGRDMADVAKDILGEHSQNLEYKDVEDNTDVLTSFAYDTSWDFPDVREKKKKTSGLTYTTHNHDMHWVQMDGGGGGGRGRAGGDINRVVVDELPDLNPEPFQDQHMEALRQAAEAVRNEAQLEPAIRIIDEDDDDGEDIW